MKHKLSYVLSVIDRIKKDPSIINKGAYLYTILIKGTPAKKRIAGFANKTLKEASEEIKETYQEEALSMTSSQYRHFACSLRSYQDKGNELTRGTVMGIANWIRKRAG